MSLNRYDARRDANEPDIVDALEAARIKVWKLSKPFDLLCGIGGRFVILEVKGKDGDLTEQQAEDLAECRYRNLPVYVVRTPEEALQAVGAIR